MYVCRHIYISLPVAIIKTFHELAPKHTSLNQQPLFIPSKTDLKGVNTVDLLPAPRFTDQAPLPAARLEEKLENSEMNLQRRKFPKSSQTNGARCI